MIHTFGTSKVSHEALKKAVLANFDLTPAGIIRELRLRRPIYLRTAAYGHFGRNEEEFTWEEIDKAPALRKALR